MDSAARPERFFFVALTLIFASLHLPTAEGQLGNLFQQRILAVDDTVMVGTGSSSFEVPFFDLQANDSSIPGTVVAIARQPSHGSLQVSGSSFLYTLDDDFRSLRHDSFAYTLMAPGGSQSTATVHLLRQFPSVPGLFQGFEVGEPINYSPGPGYLDNLVVTQAAALVGSYGLRVSAPFGESEPGYITFAPSTDTTDDGGTTLLGCGLANILEGRAVLMTLGPETHGVQDAVARIAIERLPGQLPRLFAEVRRADGSGYTSSPGVVVSTEVTNLAVEWFRDGITLEVDGLATTNHDPANAPLLFTDFRLGILEATGFGDELYLDFDQIQFFFHPETASPAPLLLSDSFEAAGFSQWNQVAGTGVSEGSVKAITGARSLQLDLGMLGNGFLVGTTQASGDRFGTRLRLDAAGGSLTGGDIVEILALGSGPGSGVGTVRYALELSETAGVPRIRLVAPRAGRTSPWHPLSISQPHHVALQLGAASAPGLPNGYLRLWIDGGIAAEIFELATFDEVVDWVHLGAKDVDPLSVGTLVFDDFESWE